MNNSLKRSPWDHIHTFLQILSPLASDSSCTCKVVKWVTLVTVCSCFNLSCRSSFPSQHVQYRTSWYVGICQVCADKWYPLGGKTHHSSYLQSLSFCPYQLVQMDTFCCPEIPKKSNPHCILNHHFYSCFELLICGLFFRGIEPVRLTIT